MRIRTLGLVFASLLGLWVAASFFFSWALFGRVLQSPGNRQGRETLVMYIFAATDPEFLNNLRFFIREAVTEDALRDYVIVVQEGGKAAANVQLPKLPRNAKYVHHANECYDWGTFGWLLQSDHVNALYYKYFIFINCSVRGPYLPAYARGQVHWTEPFLRRLQGDVKLVGPTISCEGSPLDGHIGGTWRMNPHVQSYAIATDTVGLRLLQQSGDVFRCHESRWNTIYYSELGSSSVILASGHNIDCFMTRYQGVDWRDKQTWGCNDRSSLQGEHFNDGLTLDPLEAMFVKVKSFIIMNDVSYANKAVKYHEWLQPELGPAMDDTASDASDNPAEVDLLDPEDVDAPEPRRGSIRSNEFLSDTPRFKFPRVLVAKARGNACFDFAFYLQHNADLRGAEVNSTAALWKHFVYFGQFESRPYRYTCPYDYGQMGL